MLQKSQQLGYEPKPTALVLVLDLLGAADKLFTSYSVCCQQSQNASCESLATVPSQIVLQYCRLKSPSPGVAILS